MTSSVKTKNGWGKESVVEHAALNTWSYLRNLWRFSTKRFSPTLADRKDPRARGPFRTRRKKPLPGGFRQGAALKEVAASKNPEVLTRRFHVAAAASLLFFLRLLYFLPGLKGICLLLLGRAIATTQSGDKKNDHNKGPQGQSRHEDSLP